MKRLFWLVAVFALAASLQAQDWQPIQVTITNGSMLILTNVTARTAQLTVVGTNIVWYARALTVSSTNGFPLYQRDTMCFGGACEPYVGPLSLICTNGSGCDIRIDKKELP